MKIVFFTQNLGNYISGGRLYPWFLGHCLGNAGHEVLMISNTEAIFDRDFVQFPGRKNIEFHNDKFFGQKNSNIIKRMKSCDLIMTSPMVSTDCGVTVAKNFGKKIICLLYEPYNFIEEARQNDIDIPRLNQTVERDFALQINKADMILCNTKLTALYTREWLSSFRGKIEVLYNGFNTQIADLIPTISPEKRENSITYLSRMMLYKGFGDIPDVVQRMKTKVKIHLISGSYQKNELIHQKFMAFCKEKNVDLMLHDRICEAEKFRILSKTKALFFPSRFEGFGIPPAESFYMGTPVICYDLPILKEIYKDYPHFVPIGDIDNMAEKLDELLEDNSKMFRNIDEARTHVRNFAEVGNYTKKLDDIVQSVFGKKSSFVISTPKKEEKTALFSISGGENQITYCDNPTEFEIDKCKTEYVVLHYPEVKPNEKMKEEILTRFGQNICDFMIFNYKLKDKEIKIPEFSPEATLLRPGYFGGLVACRKSVLEKYWGELHQLWDIDLALRAHKERWFRSERVCFTGTELTYVPNRILMLGRKFLKNVGAEDYWDIYDDGNGLDFNVGDIREKSQIIMLSTIPDYITAALTSLFDSSYKNFDVFVLFHNRTGDNKDYEKFVLSIPEKLRVREGIEIPQVKGDFNYSKFNSEHIRTKDYGDHHYQYYILMNDDIVLGKRTLNNLLCGFKYRWKNTGVVGAKLIYPENGKCEFTKDWREDKHEIQHAGVTLLKDVRCSHAYHKKKAYRLCVNAPKKVEAVTFGLVAIDADCYDSIGLDPNYPNDFNDIDFCVRAGLKNWDIVYNPLAVAFHHNAATRRKFNMTNDTVGQKKFGNQYQELLKNKMLLRDMISSQNGQI